MVLRNDQLADRVAPGENALLLCPPFEPAKSGSCRALLTPERPENENVLCVSLTRSPDEYVIHLHDHVDGTPAEAVIVDVDADTTADSTREPSDAAASWPSLTVDRVASPTNLTTIGTRLTDHLATWAEDTPERQTVFCFESVTALCQYTTLDQTCRFLDAVTEKVTDYDAVGHYHVDPGAVDRQTVERLTTTFDHCWEYDDGTWEDPELGHSDTAPNPRS